MNLALIDIPGLAFFWILLVIVFLQFFTRYVLNDSLGWTEEVARFLLIIVAYTGAIIAARRKSHIHLEFFYRYIPPIPAKILTVSVEIFNTCFYGYLAWLALQLAQRTHQKMVSIDLSKAVIYWTISGCLCLMALYSMIWAIRKMTRNSKKLAAELRDPV